MLFDCRGRIWKTREYKERILSKMERYQIRGELLSIQTLHFFRGRGAAKDMPLGEQHRDRVFLGEEMLF